MAEMNVQGTLDLIEEVLDNGSNIPFSSKIAVDVDAIRTYIKDIRLDLPVEIEKAQEIVDHYNSIIKKATTEASVATSTAQKQSDEILGAAKERAKGIIDNADANAKSTLLQPQQSRLAEWLSQQRLHIWHRSIRIKSAHRQPPMLRR